MSVARGHLPPNLHRAIQAAMALDLAPEQVIRDAAASLPPGVMAKAEPGKYAFSSTDFLSFITRALPKKPLLQLVPALPLLPRVWSPHLSVLDCDLPNGEPFIWHAPAKAANDTRAHG